MRHAPSMILGWLASCTLLVALAASPTLAQDAGPDPTQQTTEQQVDQPVADLPAETPPGPAARVIASPADPAPDAAADPDTEDPAQDSGPAAIGSRDQGSKAHLEFTLAGAGLTHLALPDSYQSVRHDTHIDLQTSHFLEGRGTAIPFTALAVRIDDAVVSLANPSVWRELEPGVFECFVDDPDGAPLLRITRAFTLKPGEAYGFELRNTIENLSNNEHAVSLVQTGPIDLPKPDNTYGGDRRRVRFGYMFPVELQASDTTVTVDDALEPRTKLLGKKVESAFGKVYPGVAEVWPSTWASRDGKRLSWIAMTDRYFAVAVHPLFDPDTVSRPEDKLLGAVERVDALTLNPSAPNPDTISVLRFTNRPVELDPGESVTTGLGVYAGPMSRPSMRQDPTLASLRMPEMVVYSMGGICNPCTFQWLANGLMSVLRLFHSISGDWAIAIMLLVVLVRGCLHPVTRWSQIRMQRFGVQMQGLAPKQQQLREKFKDDPKRLQQEMGKLWKEEGINPAGMLGCLPMFLQTPVWMALYATLFFAIELRQQPAFYGIFQSISGGSWEFLSDLSQPDHAIPLGISKSLPLWGTVSAINLLPLFMGGLMWAHQKFLTPPTTATMTPEQEQQQKIIKVMMVVMFPLMMYAAPAGLTIYFITNSALGIAEHKWIRAHMEKHGMLDPEKIRAERQSKGPGFMARLSEAAERQRQMQSQANGGRPPQRPGSRKKK